MKMHVRSHRALIWVGIVFAVISAVLYIALQISVTREQALSPGEKSLGVAALGMLFGIPMIIFGLGAIVCLAVGVSIAVRRKFFPN